MAGCAASSGSRPYLALLSGDDQHEPAELGPAPSMPCEAADADYVQGSRWMPGGRLVGQQAAAAASGHGIYSLAFSVLVGRRVTRCDERLPDLSARRSSTTRGSTSTSRWLDSYDLEPYVLYRRSAAATR